MPEKISEEDGILLLKVARESILKELEKKKGSPSTTSRVLPGVLPTALSSKVSGAVLKENRGTFVSLHKKGDLRGCIGNIEPDKTIFEGIKENAKHAAFHDSRFRALSLEELGETTIEISILTRPEEILYTDSEELVAELKPGIDGVMIKRRGSRWGRSATFLPQVWKQLKDPETFLHHLCLKAGLSSDEWRSGNLEVSTYQVQLFEEDH